MLTDNNLVGSDKVGTANLALSSSNVVAIDVKLANAYRIIKAGFPGAIGVAEHGGGELTIGDVEPGAVPTSLYSGFLISAPWCVSNDCRWAEFDYPSNAAGTGAPQHPLSLQRLSSMVTSGTSFTDIRRLLRQFDNESARKGPG